MKNIRIAYDRVCAKGDTKVTAKHRSTFEITQENFLSERGDCIIAVSADKSASSLSKDLKLILKQNSIVVILLKSGDEYDVVVGEGSPNLLLTDSKSIVFRKSQYIDERTVVIRANKAAKDLNRKLINKLKQCENLEVFIIGILLDKEK